MSRPAAPRPVKSEELLARARALLGQKLFDAAWKIAATLPDSADRCRLEVDILIARRAEHDLETAKRTIARWCKLSPSSPEPWGREFEVAVAQDDHARMDRALARLLRIAPHHARTLYYQALRAQIGGKVAEALGHYAAAAQQQYPDVSIATRRVMAASKAIETAMGKYPGSRGEDWAKALAQPAVIEALETSLELQDGEEGAVEETDRSLIANAWYRLALARLQGWVEAGKCQRYCERALQLNPAHQAARSTHLFALNYDPDKSPQQIYALHLAAGDWWASAFPARKRSFPNRKDEGKVLRVGYLSSDVHHHPVAYFILPVLQSHDSGRVRSHLYHLHTSRDDYTEQAAKSVFQFRHVFDFDDQALAGMIEQDGIDILVDLNGASGKGRLSLLARRVAPVQMTWLGYPNTTGLPTVDYRIVDRNTDPPPSAQALSREQLLYLPRLFSVYDPLINPPPVAASPCLRNGHVTFGSFNNTAKINSAMLRCWARILRQLPRSRLLLKYPFLDLQALQQEMRGHMQSAGIDPSRVDFVGMIKGRYQHLESYARIDIQLDTFPYHGTTTSCESMLMGVPVVTRAGSDHRSRVGVSLLHSVGHPEWIGEGEDEYVDIAVRLAQDPAALAQTRSVLREQVQASALMEAPRFTRELEQAYRECWIRWCRNGESAPPHGAGLGGTASVMN